MKPVLLTASLIVVASITTAQAAQPVTITHEIARIDPSKTLDLIRRIKTAKDGVAS